MAGDPQRSLVFAELDRVGASHRKAATKDYISVQLGVGEVKRSVPRSGCSALAFGSLGMLECVTWFPAGSSSQAVLGGGEPALAGVVIVAASTVAVGGDRSGDHRGRSAALVRAAARGPTEAPPRV